MFLFRLPALRRSQLFSNPSRVFSRFYFQKSINLREPSVQKYFDYLLAENENLLKKDLRNAFETRKLQETKQIVSLLVQREYLEKNIKSLKDSHRNEEDEQVKKMIEDEYEMCQKRSKEVETQLQTVLLEPYLTNSGILLEIVAVEGACPKLFTKELSQMYASYAKFKNWTLDIASEEDSEDGFKRASFLVEGLGALEYMELEKGAHHRISHDSEIDRISIASVMVFTRPPKSELEIPISELNVESKEAEDGESNYVCIQHIPTGTSVKCKANKSNVLNRYTAMLELRTLLFHKRQTAPPERKDKSGPVQSDAIIRTYDLSRDRVMEHRAGVEGLPFQYQLSSFMEGKEALEKLQETLLRHQHYQALMKEIKKFESQQKIEYEDEDVYTPGSM